MGQGSLPDGQGRMCFLASAARPRARFSCGAEAFIWELVVESAEHFFLSYGFFSPLCLDPSDPYNKEK